MNLCVAVRNIIRMVFQVSELLNVNLLRFTVALRSFN